MPYLHDVIQAVRIADPGSDAFLSAVEWLCSRGKWVLCDELLAERERGVEGEQARRAVLLSPGRGGRRGTCVPWLGPRQHEMEDVA